MTLLSALALAVVVLVAAPYLAHRLRRQRAEETLFAATRLVPKAPPRARRRAALEDKPLFGIRAASVVALAVLGASPFVKCSRLSLSRSGASVAVAIVIDDSMSMRAVTSGQSRFERALGGARDVVASLHDGDAVAIVLAGAPARVGLASTTDIAAARTVLEGLAESDRATDLDGALAIARTLIEGLPQVDRRVIVLSDRADGRDGSPIGESATMPVWVAMPELAGAADDCGVLSADRSGGRVRVRFACSSEAAAKARAVRVRDGDTTLASVPLPATRTGEAIVAVTGDETKELVAELGGKDAIASDDRAPVVVESGPAAIAIVVPSNDDVVATGGAPLVEQALSALRIDMATRPIPQVPDRREDLVAFAAIIVDDPPGFTPEQRHALTWFVEQGGVLMISFGRRAAAAPLGANFEPFLSNAPSFSATEATGATTSAGANVLGESLASLADLGARSRTQLAEADEASYEPIANWSDGRALFARRSRGRGEVWISTLPFSAEASDLTLRPAFLTYLDAFVADAKLRASPRRSDVGVPWTFPGVKKVGGTGPSGPITSSNENGTTTVVAALAGAYHLTLDGSRELRVASPIQREIDFAPRPIASSSASSSLGGSSAMVDMSWFVALILLGLVAAEIVLRAVTGRGTPVTR